MKINLPRIDQLKVYKKNCEYFRRFYQIDICYEKVAVLLVSFDILNTIKGFLLKVLNLPFHIVLG